MSELLFTREDLQTAVDELLANGAAPGSGMHSWRCTDKGRYSEPCTCVEEAARDVLTACLPAIKARWLREFADDVFVGYHSDEGDPSLPGFYTVGLIPFLCEWADALDGGGTPSRVTHQPQTWNASEGGGGNAE